MLVGTEIWPVESRVSKAQVTVTILFSSTCMIVEMKATIIDALEPFRVELETPFLMPTFLKKAKTNIYIYMSLSFYSHLTV